VARGRSSGAGDDLVADLDRPPGDVHPDRLDRGDHGSHRLTGVCHSLAMTSPSGIDVVLRSDPYEAHVVEVGAGLRTLTRDGLDVVDGYGPDEMCSAGRGQLLSPWPNRIEDGRYDVGGRSLQLPLSEAAARNAIHGLVRWTPWRLDGTAEASARWSHRLYPQPGYPFTLDLTVTYELSGNGLRLTVEAANVGGIPAPYGFGAHPYLTVGRSVDDCILEVPASRYCDVDDRGLPGEARPVEGTPYDFLSPRPVGATTLDHPFSGVEHADGWGSASLTDPDTGRAARVSFDGALRWLQVYSADSHGPTARQYLAVEPMTCPPNAFRSGVDLVVLQPGDTHAARLAIS
jgi:aldose 1-epimerase